MRNDPPLPEPVFVAKSDSLLTLDTDRVCLFEDSMLLERRKGGFIPGHEQRIRYEDIAQVAVTGGLLYCALVVETRGGGRLVANRLSRKDAKRAADLIENLRLRGTRGR
jgi:hypothetical protein